MLERAPATAESAAHHFLRSFERPCRSARTLDPKFWRHGTDQIDTAGWWASYLQQVRQVPQTRRPCADNLHVESVATLRWKEHSSQVKKIKLKGQCNTRGERRYTNRAPLLQAQAVQPRYDTFDSRESIEFQQELDAHIQQAVLRDTGTDRIKPRKSGPPNTPRRVVTDSAAFFDAVDAIEQERPARSRRGPEAPTGYEYLEKRSATPPAAAEDQQLSSTTTEFDFHSPFAALVSRSTIEDVDDNAKTADTEPKREPTGWKLELETSLDLSDHRQKTFNEIVQAPGKASAENIEKAWKLFIAFNNQEKIAPYMFRFLTQVKGAEHLSRAFESFKLIPREKRSVAHYKTVVALELRRFHYGSATNLAFEATIRGFDALPDLLAHFVDKRLWTSAAELLHRNKTARRDLAAFAPNSAPRDRPEMLDIADLVKRCEEIGKLPEKVLALAQRLENNDPILREHQKLLNALRNNLVVMCMQSAKAMSTMSTSGLLALLQLQRGIRTTDLHHAALYTILNMEGRQNHVELALLVYRNFRFVKPQSKVRTWMLGGLISICGDAQYPSKVYKYILDEFEHNLGKPDEIAYQRVLTSCARQGDTGMVERLFTQYLHHHGKPKNIAWLSPLIYGYAVAGDPINARKQFERIRDEFSLQPNETCWTMLLLAHARSEDDISAFDTFEEMQKTDVRPGSYTYGILLAVCAAHADTAAALALLADARDAGVAITVPMINTIVEAYLQHHDVDAALRFALAVTRSGTSESLTRLWTIFVRYFAARGDASALLKVRHIMTQYKVKADEMTYAALMTSLTSKKRTSEAVEMLREMHNDRGMVVNAFHYSIVLHGFAMEHNRDMALTIFEEMKAKFPRMGSAANQAMLLLQAQRRSIGHEKNESSLRLVTASIQDLYNSTTTSSYADLTSGQPQKTSVVASLYFDTMLESLMQTGSYDQAAELVNQFGIAMNAHGQSKTLSMKLSLAKMDIAIARDDDDALHSIWGQLFREASEAYRPIRAIQKERQEQVSNKEHLDDISKQSSARPNRRVPVLGAWRTSLSKHVNRYIEAMVRKRRQTRMVQFLQTTFKSAGFRLTGINLNRYIQALCRSRNTAHHVRAFRLTEKTMLNRAQSWKMLSRGLMRQKSSRYVLESIGTDDRRPVLQKKNTFSVAKRIDVMYLDPRRPIPTYTSMVHLGAVLRFAESKAKGGSKAELQRISAIAPDTKKFLRQMPYLKDEIQGELLRGLHERSDPKPRPRSEESMRAKTVFGGILGSDSLLDYLPAEFQQELKAIPSPRNDAREMLTHRSDASRTLTKYEERDVQLGEKYTGIIARHPIILAGQGRLETTKENRRRIYREEQEKLEIVRNARRDLRRRELVGNISPRSTDSIVGPPIDSVEESSLLGDQVNSRVIAPVPSPLLRSMGSSADRTRPEDETDSTVDKLSVFQQLEIFEQRRVEGSARAMSRRGRPNRGLANPVAERRRLRRLIALKQRRDAQQWAARLPKYRALSPRAFMPRTAAARRYQVLHQAKERRRAYLQYEAGLKAGKRLDPLPKTERTYRERRRTQGPISVRFVADLNRRKDQYLIRRGLVPETRKSSLVQRLDQQEIIEKHRDRRPPAIPKRPIDLSLLYKKPAIVGEDAVRKKSAGGSRGSFQPFR